MITVTAFEAKTHFGKILDQVAAGEEIVVTRHEKAVARIVPEGRRSVKQISQAVDELMSLRGRIAARTRRQKPLTHAEIKSAIAEGRR